MRVFPGYVGYIRGTKLYPGHEGISGVRGYIRGMRVYPGYEGISGVRGYIRGIRRLDMRVGYQCISCIRVYIQDIRRYVQDTRLYSNYARLYICGISCIYDMWFYPGY